jgi:hypothetical protein
MVDVSASATPIPATSVDEVATAAGVARNTSGLLIAVDRSLLQMGEGPTISSIPMLGHRTPPSRVGGEPVLMAASAGQGLRRRGGGASIDETEATVCERENV